MADVEISYGGSTIVAMTDSGTEILDTDRTYMTDNITVAYTKSGITPSGTKSISITSNGTTTEDVTNYASAQIAVNVPTGITPTGTISITQNGTVDVTNYATANVNVSGGGGGDNITVSVSNFLGRVYYIDSADGVLKYISSTSITQSVPKGSMVVLLWEGPKAPGGATLTNLTVVFSVNNGSRATYKYTDFCLANQ